MLKISLLCFLHLLLIDSVFAMSNQKDSLRHFCLCEENTDKMYAIIVDNKDCLLIKEGDNFWKWIKPDEVAKLNIINVGNQKFEQKAVTYAGNYKDKIIMIIIVKMKDGCEWEINTLLP